MNYLFEWDLSRELENIAKHGHSFEEAVEVFSDPNVIHPDDPGHSSVEDRHHAVGRSEKGSIHGTLYVEGEGHQDLWSCRVEEMEEVL